MVNEMQQQCAATVMDTFHMMMRTVGPEARKRSSENLTMQQFGAMKTIEEHEGASLSLVCGHIGMTLSATSKLVDGLVERGLVRRETAEDDRRRLILALSDKGIQFLESAHMDMISCLSDKFSALTPGECGMLNLAMDLLRWTLTTAQNGRSMHRGEH